MSAWLAGLIGVVVGGVLNGAVAALLDLRQLRRQRRVAARLVSEELLMTISALNVSLNYDRWRGARAMPPPLNDWAEQRAVLAAGLRFEDWREILPRPASSRLSSMLPQTMSATTRSASGIAR